MNGTTDDAVARANKFHPKHLLRLVGSVIVLCAVLFLIAVLLVRSGNPFQGWTRVLMPAGIAAAGETVRMGIEEFQYGRAPAVATEPRVLALVSLLLWFVCAPTLVVLGYPRLQGVLKAGSALSPVRLVMRDAGFLIGALMCGLLLVGTPLMAFRSSQTFEMMKVDRSNSSERDAISAELVDLYVMAVQHVYRMEPALDSKLTLNTLGIPERTVSGAVVLQPVVSDTLIVITIVGSPRHPANSFRNADGQVGRIQQSIEITLRKPSFQIRYEN